MSRVLQPMRLVTHVLSSDRLIVAGLLTWRRLLTIHNRLIVSLGTNVHRTKGASKLTLKWIVVCDWRLRVLHIHSHTPLLLMARSRCFEAASPSPSAKMFAQNIEQGIETRSNAIECAFARLGDCMSTSDIPVRTAEPVVPGSRLSAAVPQIICKSANRLSCYATDWQLLVLRLGN